MKKIGLLFATIIMMMLFAVSASALDASGSLGDNVTYTYDSTTGEVVISGNGAMKDYDSGSSPFYNNSGIKSVVIEDSVTSIGDYAFHYCTSLESITIPDSVTSIGYLAFGGCTSLTSITIPDSVTSIGDYAFYACESLTSITIPDGVTSIGNGAFLACESLTSITIPESVTSIGGSAFAVCYSLTSITIPDRVTSIGYAAFLACESLTSITIPDSVTSIGNSAFYDCYSLTSITIGSGVTSIGNYAFYGCTGLKDVYYGGSQNQWNKIAIGSYNDLLLNATIHYDYKPHTHSYIAEITTVPTHLAEGVMTYTCDCGDSYTEAIAKTLEHTYKALKITESTCEDAGYTTYICECGDTYKDDYVNASGHSFTNYISDGTATCVTDGKLIAKCDNCNATDSVIEKGTHKFSEDFITDVEATCTNVGEKSRHCLYCSEVTDKTSVDKLPHNYYIITINPSCTDRGHKIYTCNCGDNFDESIPAKGHNFNGSVCTDCGYNRANYCSCNCHKTGLFAIIWMIINIFNKLLKKNPVCACGAAHY